MLNVGNYLDNYLIIATSGGKLGRNGGDSITYKVSPDLADFPEEHSQSVVFRVEHSHWSRSVEILCSDWLNFTMVVPRSVP